MSDLPQRTPEELIWALRSRAPLISGQGWEAPATAAMMNEASSVIEALIARVRAAEADADDERPVTNKDIIFAWQERDKARQRAEAAEAKVRELEQHIWTIKAGLSYDDYARRVKTLEAQVRALTAERDVLLAREPKVANISGHPNIMSNVYADLGFTAADFHAQQARITALEDALREALDGWANQRVDVAIRDRLRAVLEAKG